MGIGYELVPALDVPVLQTVEQPVDASAMAFLEEEEAKALNAEFSMLARTATSHTVRLREVMMRMHVLRQKGRGRKKKKRRKKKLPKASFSRSSCASHAARTRISGRSSTCPFFLAVLFGVMVLPEEYFGAFPYSAIPWFYYGYSSCVSQRKAAAQAVPAAEESDGSAPCCGMSGCPSLWPWPRSCTTAHSARRWPGPGRRRAR